MPLPNEEMFNSNMDWIHSLMLNTTRQNFLRRIEKLDNVVLLSPHRAPFMDRFLGEFIKGSRDGPVGSVPDMQSETDSSHRHSISG